MCAPSIHQIPQLRSTKYFTRWVYWCFVLVATYNHLFKITSHYSTPCHVQASKPFYKLQFIREFNCAHLYSYVAAESYIRITK